MNRISIIGAGYVGLVTGACLSEFGLQITCVDVDKRKIEKLKEGILPIYEPGLDDLVKKNIRVGRMVFSTEIQDAVADATAIFIAVGTPPQSDGSADLQQVLEAARSIAENMGSYRVIVCKSTVPIGTCRKVRQVVSETLKMRNLDIPFDIVSNPEFLREGSAVRDFMHPDRIVIGYENERAREIMQFIYRVLYLNNYPFVFTGIETAELIKYASNAFLATKITFANEIANLCEAVGADVNHVTNAMGLDGRIARYFLHPGPGYGGSCFPKDTRALAHIGSECGVRMSIVETVIAANEKQKLWMINKIISAMDGVNGKTIAVLGLAFKPETDDVREAPSIAIINGLINSGASIRTFDPIAMDNARNHAFSGLDIYYASSEYDAVSGSDALVLMTEWNQFRNLCLELVKKIMPGRIFFDLRNIYEKKVVVEAGFTYYGVGR